MLGFGTREMPGDEMKEIIAPDISSPRGNISRVCHTKVLLYKGITDRGIIHTKVVLDKGIVRN